MSLIELLCALTILSVFTVAATSWMTTSAMAQTAIKQSIDKQVTLQRVIELLRTDLDNAVPQTVSPDLATGRLTMITTDVTAQGSPSWRRTQWFLEPNSGDLIRSTQTSDRSNPKNRPVAWNVRRFSLAPLSASDTQANTPAWIALRIDLEIDGATARLIWERPQ